LLHRATPGKPPVREFVGSPCDGPGTPRALRQGGVAVSVAQPNRRSDRGDDARRHEKYAAMVARLAYGYTLTQESEADLDKDREWFDVALLVRESKGLDVEQRLIAAGQHLNSKARRCPDMAATFGTMSLSLTAAFKVDPGPEPVEAPEELDFVLSILGVTA